MRNELFLYAHLYHNLGMNLSPIKDSNYKKPILKNWESYESIGQNDETIFSHDWTNSCGIGIILGFNDYRAIDIDNLAYTYYDENESYREKRIQTFIKQALNILGLPQDYEWVINSGSGKGLHIIFRANDFQSSKNIYSYSPNLFFKYECELFERIELRWKSFLVLPPSKHLSTKCYSFRNNSIPSYKPHYVSLNKMNEFLNYFCSDLVFIECNYKKEYQLNLAKLKKIHMPFTSGPDDYNKEEVENINMLKECNTPDAFNSLGVMYALGKSTQSDLKIAFDYFKLSNNQMAHFNLASLMACGAISGTKKDISFHLNFCSDYPQEKISLIEFNHKKYLNSNTSKIKYLFLDTETTGIPSDYNAPSSQISNWPRLVQISWSITDETSKIIKEENHIIYPKGFTIPKDASTIHKITTEKAQTYGKSLTDVMRIFINDFKEADYIIGHNINFDKRIIGAELIRLGQMDIMDTKPFYCTMISSTNYCKIPGPYGYKYPQLKELYEKLFGDSFIDAHNSQLDVKATIKCFWEMKRKNLITETL